MRIKHLCFDLEDWFRYELPSRLTDILFWMMRKINRSRDTSLSLKLLQAAVYYNKNLEDGVRWDLRYLELERLQGDKSK